jgi:uncharacterized membrane protein YoaK (UPF0700 family)
MVWGMLLGMAVGVVLGSATGRPGLWLPLGLVGGMFVGLLVSRRRRAPETPRAGDSPPRT